MQYLRQIMCAIFELYIAYKSIFNMFCDVMFELKKLHHLESYLQCIQVNPEPLVMLFQHSAVGWMGPCQHMGSVKPYRPAFDIWHKFQFQSTACTFQVIHSRDIWSKLSLGGEKVAIWQMLWPTAPGRTDMVEIGILMAVYNLYLIFRSRLQMSCWGYTRSSASWIYR